MRNEKQTPNTCVIYIRVSSDEQVQGTSLETQERICREYAERNDWEVKEVFVEEGKSAKTANRPMFGKALAYATNKKNKIGYFIVYKVDRFARKREDHVSVAAVLRKSGAKLRSATEPIDDSPIGKLTEGMLASYAEFDNDIRGERTKE